MATAIGDLVINLAARTSQFTGPMLAARSHIAATERAAVGMASRLRSMFSGLGSLTGAGGLLGIFAAGGMTAGIAKAIDLSETQTQAERKLQAVLEATGYAAGFSAQELFQYAGALQAVTNYGDEATIAAMAVLATFRQVSGGVFKEAVAAMQDMSTVLGTDLSAAAVLVGKALNDPIAGLTALRRVGVAFTDQQKDQIKALVEAGDLIGAQKVILAELKNEFGGAAKAVASPLTQMKNAIGDLGETIGAAIVPMVRYWAKEQQAVAEATNATLASGTEARDVFLAIGDVIWGLGMGLRGIWTGAAGIVALIYIGLEKIGAVSKELADNARNNAADAAEGMVKSWEAGRPSLRIIQDEAAARALKPPPAMGRPPGDESTGAVDSANKLQAALEDLKTPADRLNESLKQLDEWEAAGLVNPTQRLHLFVKAWEDYEKAIGSPAQKIQDLKDKLESLQQGLSDTEIEARQMAKRGAAPEQVDEFRDISGKLQAEQEKREKQETLKRSGKQLAEQLRTPLEAYQDELARINEMLAGGAIDATTAQRARDAAGEKYLQEADQQGNDKPYAGALEKGSAEAYSRILEAMAQKDRDQEKRAALDAANQTAKNTERIADLLERQDDASGDGMDIPG